MFCLAVGEPVSAASVFPRRWLLGCEEGAPRVPKKSFLRSVNSSPARCHPWGLRCPVPLRFPASTSPQQPATAEPGAPVPPKNPSVTPQQLSWSRPVTTKPRGARVLVEIPRPQRWRQSFIG